jgi:hypothetical protein
MADMKHSNLITRIIIGVIASVLTGGGAFGGVVAAAALVRSEARAQAREEVREQLKTVDRIDAGMKGIDTRVATLEQQVPQLRAEVYDGRVEQKEYARGLQEVILTNRPSAKLNKPLPPPPPVTPPRGTP